MISGSGKVLLNAYTCTYTSFFTRTGLWTSSMTKLDGGANSLHTTAFIDRDVNLLLLLVLISSFDKSPQKPTAVIFKSVIFFIVLAAASVLLQPEVVKKIEHITKIGTFNTPTCQNNVIHIT